MLGGKGKLMVSRLISIIDNISQWSGKTVAWLSVPLVVVVVYEVIARKFFSPTIWAFDLSYMIYGSQFLLATAFCLYKKSHVRTDVWYGSWSPRTQGLVDSILYIFLFLPGMVFFVYLSLEFFYESWLIREVSTHSPWRQIIYPFKATIPLAMGLLTLQGIAELVKSIRRFRGIEVPSVVEGVSYDE